MKPTPISAAMIFVCLFFASAVSAQAPATRNSPLGTTAEIPRLIKFSGTLRDEQERPLAGPVGVTFALYAQQSGGAALWMETQNVKSDASGNYAVFLGANSANGVPAELFVSAEARWLGVQVGQQPEHERILLVSVPYALKAADAETLGGLPASAFVTTGMLATPGGAAPSNASLPGAPPKSGTGVVPKKAAVTPQVVCASVTSDGTATANSIALLTTACNVESSLMTQTLINGFPGVALAGNNVGLELSGTGTHQVQVTGATSGRLGQDASGFFFASDTNGKAVRFLTNNGALNEWMRITSAGNVGIGTTAPTARLHEDQAPSSPNGADAMKITSGGSQSVASLLLQNTGSGGLYMRHGVGTSMAYVASSGALGFVTNDTGTPSFPSRPAMSISTSGDVAVTGNFAAGNLTLAGTSSGIHFADGSSLTTASGSNCTPFEMTSSSPVPPAGYIASSSVTAGNVWFAMSSMPTSRYFLGAATVNGKVYAIGGWDYTEVNALATVEVFDPLSNTWTAATPMPTARAGLAVAALNGKIYAIGGQGTGGDFNTVEVYDPALNTWTTAAPLPTARSGLAAVALNGKLYAIGGDSTFAPVVAYDPGTNSWSPAAPMTVPRTYPAAAALNGKIYAMGGNDSGGADSFVEVYDPTSNSWSMAAPLPTANSGLGAASVGGKIYVTGGIDISHNAYVYDVSSNSWTTTAPLVNPRVWGAVSDANGLIYAVGGVGPTNFPFGGTEQYTPPLTVYTFLKY